MRKTLLILTLAIVLSSLTATACSAGGTPAPAPTPTPTPSPSPSPMPGGGTVVRSDSIVTGQIKAMNQEPTGYPWAVDVLVQSSESVDNLPNPTADKVGQVIMTRTDQDMSPFAVGQAITAHVKYAGDAVTPGIFLYLYDVQAK